MLVLDLARERVYNPQPLLADTFHSTGSTIRWNISSKKIQRKEKRQMEQKAERRVILTILRLWSFVL